MVLCTCYRHGTGEEARTHCCQSGHRKCTLRHACLIINAQPASAQACIFAQQIWCRACQPRMPFQSPAGGPSTAGRAAAAARQDGLAGAAGDCRIAAASLHMPLAWHAQAQGRNRMCLHAFHSRLRWPQDATGHMCVDAVQMMMTAEE